MSACDPSSPAFFLYNIPICGGFCAPTVSPEPTCWKHVSNEFTIPASGVFMKGSEVLEFAPCCRFFGKLGLQEAANNRKVLMGVAAFLNIVSFALCILAAISGLSTNGSMVKALPWVTGEVTVGEHATVKLYLSITSRVDEVTCYTAECDLTAANRLSHWDNDGSTLSRTMDWTNSDACADVDLVTDLVPGASSIVGIDICEECKENLLASFSLVFSIIGSLPTLTTNLQRATSFGDVNCQACWAVGSNLVSFVSSGVALLAFGQSCYGALPDTGREEWSLGVAFWAVAITLVIRVIDTILHILLPTPAVRWKKTNKPLTLEEYMGLATSKEQAMGGQVSPVQAQTVGAKS
mmetsp:Transcript_9407/g.13104  ORF Transcript_9407/g.13104 Transcript_9407/m.13104 type:complete len:351 (-) Transcript_9407:63-1115(-)